MLKPINILYALIAELLCVFYSGCSSPTGGGSDTDALTGVVKSIDGYCTAGLAVNLYDTSFCPFRTNRFHTGTTTDASGKFHFKSFNAPVFNIVCIDSLHGMGCIISNVNFESIKADSPVVCSLTTLGSVTGVFKCRDSSQQKDLIKNGYVYIYGSPFHSKIDSTGGFTLKVPTCKFFINYYSVDIPQFVTPGGHPVLHYVGPEMLLEPGSTSILDTIDIKNWKMQR